MHACGRKNPDEANSNWNPAARLLNAIYQVSYLCIIHIGAESFIVSPYQWDFMTHFFKSSLF